MYCKFGLWPADASNTRIANIQKQRGWRNVLPVSKKRTMSFTNRMEKSTATAKSAGPKPGSPDGSGSSYTLYDSCNKCPLRAYIEMVCNDNLRALVIGGNPLEEVLQEVRMALVAEFHELSEDALSSSLNNRARQVTLCKVQILGLTLATRLLAEGSVKEALGYLNKNGIRVVSAPENEEGWKRLAGKIEAKIRALKVKIREAVKQYSAMLDKEKGGKYTPKDFNDQLVLLSKHAGFRLTVDISLAEYAGYLKDYKNALKYGKYDK